MKITERQLRQIIREELKPIYESPGSEDDPWIDADQATIEYMGRVSSGETQDAALDAVISGHHDTIDDPASLTPDERTALLQDLEKRSEWWDSAYLPGW